MTLTFEPDLDSAKANHLDKYLGQRSPRSKVIVQTRRRTHTEIWLLVGIDKLECGPMPNVMAALPNIGGALCSTPQSLANAHY